MTAYLRSDSKSAAAVSEAARWLDETCASRPVPPLLIVVGLGEGHLLDVLEQRMREQELDLDAYWWYRELRQFGTVPHAGFGLGLERVVQFITGMQNIRDVIPFPRTPGSAEF